MQCLTEMLLWVHSYWYRPLPHSRPLPCIKVVIKVFRNANNKANTPETQQKYAKASISKSLSPKFLAVPSSYLIHSPAFGEWIPRLGTSSPSKCASFVRLNWRPSDPFHWYRGPALHSRRPLRLLLWPDKSIIYQQIFYREGHRPDGMNFQSEWDFFLGEGNCGRPYIPAWEKGGSWWFDDGKGNICFMTVKKSWSCSE